MDVSFVNEDSFICIHVVFSGLLFLAVKYL